MIKREWKSFKRTIEIVPGWVLTMFVLSITLMNLFANKSINLPVSWLALDCGILFSWATFLSMDLIVKHFGAKASIQVSLLATIISLIVSAMMAMASVIGGMWGESFAAVDPSIVNNAIDATVRGNWYIVFGSTVAFVVASIVNSISNEVVGKLFKTNRYGYLVFAIRTYVSTTLGQFIDNLVFALIVSQVLFGWTFVQCVTCAATGALCELLFEAVFTPFAWKICIRWRANNLPVV